MWSPSAPRITMSSSSAAIAWRSDFGSCRIPCSARKRSPSSEVEPVNGSPGRLRVRIPSASASTSTAMARYGLHDASGLRTSSSGGSSPEAGGTRTSAFALRCEHTRRGEVELVLARTVLVVRARDRDPHRFERGARVEPHFLSAIARREVEVRSGVGRARRRRTVRFELEEVVLDLERRLDALEDVAGVLEDAGDVLQ